MFYGGGIAHSDCGDAARTGCLGVFGARTLGTSAVSSLHFEFDGIKSRSQQIEGSLVGGDDEVAA